MRFSPLALEYLILESLKEFFHVYAPEQLKYSHDELETKIEIGAIHNFNKVNLQTKPRILFDRGGYNIEGVGFNESLYSSEGPMNNGGLSSQQNLALINGMATLFVDSRNEGTAEVVVDLVTHFFFWSRPFICNMVGLKNFAKPMSVSQCSPMREDTEIFRCVISFPYSVEESWVVNKDAINLKDIYQKISTNLSR